MKKSNRFCTVFFIVAVGYFSVSCKKEEPQLPEIKITNYSFYDYDMLLYGSAEGTVISDGGSPITSMGMLWSTHELPTILDEIDTRKIPSTSTGTGKFSCTIMALGRSTTYYVRAYAINNNGTAYSNQVSFTTPIITSFSKFYTYLSYPTDEAVAVSTNPVLRWGYVISWSYVNCLNDVYLDTEPIPTTKIATNISSTSLNVTGLEPNTTYYWKVNSWETGYPGNSSISDIHSFTTAPAPKTP